MPVKSNELRSQADNLRKEIEAQVTKKNDLEMCAYTAEKKIKELYQKLKSLQKISDEQRTIISNIKHDIQFAEERLVKLKIEASLASEGAKQNWIPRMKQQWLMVMVYLESGIVEFQNTANPYTQGFKRFLKPYLTQISVTSKPQFDIVTHALKRHSRQIVQIYERLMRPVMAHHSQVQSTIRELLKVHEYTRPFADKDLVWYLASAIFALPAILIVNLYTSLVSYKPQKHSHKHRIHRRAKKSGPEN